MSNKIFYGTNPVPPPGYRAIPIPVDENIPPKQSPEITEEEILQKKKNAILAGISAAKKSGRTGVMFKQRPQLPGRWR